MAYVFLSDDGPDAEDYDNNYFYFDELNLHAVELIKKMFRSSAERDSEFRTQLQNICQSSFNHRNAKNNNYMICWIKSISKLIKQAFVK